MVSAGQSGVLVTRKRKMSKRNRKSKAIRGVIARALRKYGIPEEDVEPLVSAIRSGIDGGNYVIVEKGWTPKPRRMFPTMPRSWM
jgi:hypothetical protein